MISFSEQKQSNFLNFVQNLPKSIKILTCGLFSGFCSRIVVSPLERVSILQQTNKTQKFIKINKEPTTQNLMFSIYNKEGIKGIFRGSGIQLLRVVPLTALEFFYYDFSKEFFMDFFFPEIPKNIKNLTAGCLSGMMAYATVYPIDFIGIQKSTGQIPNEWSLFKSFRNVRKKIGYFKMFQGLGATQMCIIPFTGIKFLVFELSKEFIQEIKSEQVNNYQNLIAGSISGLVATIATYPIEILRRRKQVYGQDQKKNKMGYKEISKLILKEQGIKGFYQGLQTMIYKTVPTIALAFYFNEWSKSKLKLNKF